MDAVYALGYVAQRVTSRVARMRAAGLIVISALALLTHGGRCVRAIWSPVPPVRGHVSPGLRGIAASQAIAGLESEKATALARRRVAPWLGRGRPVRGLFAFQFPMPPTPGPTRENDTCRVTIVLCTFSRAHLLGPALDAALSQIDGTPSYELLLVDNNSRDRTREIVQQREASGSRLRYVFEAQQGLSFARNAGIVHARGDIVAFTDDDVRVAPNWVSRIHAAFETHAHVDCVGGRILPEWSVPPPAWLTKDRWVGALALQDYGPERLMFDPKNPVCLAGANLAFRKRVFENIGAFSTEFGSARRTRS